MKQLSIYKNGTLTNQLTYETLELLESELAKYEAMGTFGTKASSYEQLVSEAAEAVTEQELVSEAVLAEDGTELEAAVYKEVEISPAIDAVYETINVEGWEALIEDISAQIEQEKINVAAQAFLDATDWMVIRAVEKNEEISPELKAERQAARDRIVK
jgi:hypothetical protein